MREPLMTAASDAYAEHFRVDRQSEPERMGFDGWLVAIRAMVVLIVGMLAISFAAIL
jgi:hypothetical protein